jgi:hypothetical protein
MGTKIDLGHVKVDVSDYMHLEHILAYLFIAVTVPIPLVLGKPLSTVEGYGGYFALVVLYSLGVGSVLWGLKTFRRYRAITGTENSMISSLPDGNVGISGRAKSIDNNLKTAPLSQEECLYYKVKVIDSGVMSAGGRRDKIIFDEESSDNFILDDGTDFCIVDLEEADIKVGKNLKLNEEDEREIVDQFLSRRGIETSPYGTVFEERIIKPNQELYVYGHSDTTAVDQERYKTIEKGDSPFYLISDQSEEEIEQKTGKWYIIAIMGGIATSAFSFWVMSIPTGLV